MSSDLCNNIIEELKTQSNPKNIEGMARFGVKSKNILGISIPVLRKTAKEAGKSHKLAQELWETEIHEARILAAYVDIPEEVTEEQMENWVKDFVSWDVCDQVCSNLFEKTEFVHQKILEWVEREEEFVKRAGFVLIARLAVSDKKAENEFFIKFFPLLIEGASDERNFVKKAVNWAVRQIGKRNLILNQEAIRLSEEIKQLDSKSARWIASDALRELKSDEVQKRLKNK